LDDKEHFTKEIRADVAKAVAHVGYDMGSSAKDFQEFNRQISVMNYANVWVGDGEMDQAQKLAKRILGQVGQLEKDAENLKARYIDSPSQVSRFPGLEWELERKISAEEIQEKAKFIQERRGNLDPVSQLKAKLAGFWLMVVDGGNWKETNALKTGAHGAFLLRRTEEFLNRLQMVDGRRSTVDGGQTRDQRPATISQEAFIKICDEIRDFLNGGLKVTGKGLGRKVKDFFASATIPQMMNPIPQANRIAYDDLKQWVDEILAACELGETVDCRVSTVDGPLEDVKSQFIRGLQQAKRSLWYGYKQHKAISRGISRVASWFNSGDIEDIQEGQREIDQVIKRVEAAQDPTEIENAVHQLQDQLREKGKIHLAICAAEMEGNEQLLGLGQTILILLATRGVYQRAAMWKAARAGGEVVAEASAVSSGTLGQRIWQGIKVHPELMVKSFGLGAYLSAAENAVAVSSGEVRSTGEHWLTWGRDSLATAAAMALFAPLTAHYGSSSLSPSLFKRVWARYTTSYSSIPKPWLRYAVGVGKDLSVIGGDAVFETGEEWLDAWFRAQLEDGNRGVSFDQAREIALVSGLGGFTKMGSIGEMLRERRTRGHKDTGIGDPRSKRKSGNGELVEGSESLTPPSLFPKSSRDTPLDLGFLKSLAARPSLWFGENRTLLAQVLLVSMVGAGILQVPLVGIPH
jgi:hypothetical protein